MKIPACVLVLASLAALPAFAQTSPPPKFAPLPPPPAMNAPGVKAVAPPSQPAPAGSSSPAEVTATPLPGKPIPLPTLPGEKTQGASAPSQPPPDVDVHTEGGKVYQTYRRGGRPYMVVVTDASGLSYTYMVDDHGTMRATNGAPPVRPVMYKILQWGGGKAPKSGE